jgi:hypothetical protein
MSLTSIVVTPMIPNSKNGLKGSQYYFNHIVSYDDSTYV